MASVTEWPIARPATSAQLDHSWLLERRYGQRIAIPIQDIGWAVNDDGAQRLDRDRNGAAQVNRSDGLRLVCGGIRRHAWNVMAGVLQAAHLSVGGLRLRSGSVLPPYAV